MVRLFQRRGVGYVAAVLGIAAVAAACVVLRSHVNEMGAALAMLLVVLVVAIVWQRGPAVLASGLAMLCLNYFFLAPLHALRIDDSRDWVALGAFLFTAFTVGELSLLANQRRAEAEAERQQARQASAYNRSLIEASLDPLVTIGRDGKITDVNAATEIATGHSRAELIGTDFSDYFAEPEKAREGYRAVFRQGFVRDFPLEVRHRDGHTMPVLYNASVYRDEADQVVGVFAAARDITERKRAEEEVRTLNADLEQRVIRRTAELQAATKELELAHEREIEIGFKIQQTLLLDQPPEVPAFRVAALTVPSQRIDGDFYIFIRHSDECLDVIVGDVMGKGIPAALLGAATKSHFLKALNDLMGASKDGDWPEPKEIVMLAHAELVRRLINLDSFVTLVYARFDENRRSLSLVDCGHTGVLHWHAKTALCEIVHGDNLPLGIREGEIYNQVSVPFEAGDSLVFFSDGITEARNPSKELFGFERLKECVASNGQLLPGALVEAIRKAVFTFSDSIRLTDDLTAVAVRVEERQVPIARAEIEIGSDLKHLRQAREFVRAFSRGLPGGPLDEDSAGALELAVNEAASNIVKHAYQGRSDQWIHLEAEAFLSHVSIRLHHLGEPFDPSAAPPPPLDGSRESGFGAYIISRSVDEVRYHRDERGRNCIALIKLRKSLGEVDREP